MPQAGSLRLPPGVSTADKVEMFRAGELWEGDEEDKKSKTKKQQQEWKRKRRKNGDRRTTRQGWLAGSIYISLAWVPVFREHTMHRWRTITEERGQMTYARPESGTLLQADSTNRPLRGPVTTTANATDSGGYLQGWLGREKGILKKINKLVDVI